MSFLSEYERRCTENSDINSHLPRLFTEVSKSENTIVLELGVRSGNSTAAFLAGVEKSGGHVSSVDISLPNVPTEWFESDLWTFIEGNDLEVGGLLPDTVDVLFIDTSHTYMQTLLELEMFAGRVRPGGVILLHDTELGVPDGGNPDDPPYPVAVAIREWAEKQAVAPMIEWVPGCNGLAVITM